MSEGLFGPYRLDGLIGRGGMGEVYRAYDTGKERVVALKRLPAHLADDADFQTRFRRESKVAARLTEPHIIPIHDFGEIEGQLFIDMRLVNGLDLAGLLTRDGPLPPARAVNIIAQVASALAAAHSAELVHRDVKPSNILISEPGGQEYVYLVDFGLAHSPGMTTMTATGITIGTLAYMAPERFLGRGIDHRVDTYALGCVLFEALTAQRPFPGESGPELMYGHLNLSPPVLSQHRPGLPSGLDSVILHAMAKDPNERPQSVLEVAVAAHNALLTHPGTRPPVTAGYAGETRPVTEPSSSSPDLLPTGAPPAPPAASTWSWAQHASARTQTRPPAPPRVVPPPEIPPPPPAPELARPNRWRKIALTSLAVLFLVGVAGAVIARPSGSSGSPEATRAAPQPATKDFDVSTIAIGGRVGDLAIDPAKHTLYASNLDGDPAIIDTNTQAVTGTIPVDGYVQSIAFDAGAQMLYGTNFNDRVIKVVDVAKKAVVATLPAPGGPNGLTLGPNLLYVLNVNENHITVIDTVKRAEVARIPTGNYATAISTDLSGGMTLQLLFIGQSDSQTKTGSVLVVDAEPKVVSSIPLGQPASGVAFEWSKENSSGTIYAATHDGAVSVVDLGAKTVTARIAVGKNPLHLAIDSERSTLYVANSDDNTVSVIDTVSRRVTSTIPVGKSPSALVVDPQSHVVYCANSNDDKISVLKRTG